MAEPMSAAAQDNVRTHVHGILDEVNWSETAKAAALFAIDWAQAWIVPSMQKVNPAVGQLLAVALQVAEDYLRAPAT